MLGWKYVEASEESQKYKVGKFILETKRIRMGVSWEGDEEAEGEIPPNEVMNMSVRDGEGGEGMEFDSQDEDECEDLFAGVWSPALAMKRRRGRRFGRVRGGPGGRARSEDML